MDGSDRKKSSNSLYPQVAVSSSGLTFLEKAGLLDSLAELMDNEDESDTGVVLTKSLAFKFFGKLGENKV